MIRPTKVFNNVMTADKLIETLNSSLKRRIMRPQYSWTRNDFNDSSIKYLLESHFYSFTIHNYGDTQKYNGSAQI